MQFLQMISFVAFIPRMENFSCIFQFDCEWEDWRKKKNITTWYLELSILCQTLKRSLHSFTLSLFIPTSEFHFFFHYYYEYFLMKSTHENVAYAWVIKINSHHHKKADVHIHIYIACCQEFLFSLPLSLTPFFSFHIAYRIWTYIHKDVCLILQSNSHIHTNIRTRT